MGEFEPYEPGVEVRGETLQAFVDGIPSAFEDRANEILARNGISDPQEGEWYPQQAWLDSFADVAEGVGESTLTNIGRSIPANAEWPPGIETVVAGLESIDDAYQMNHRGGEIGEYRVEEIDETTARIHCDNPYACAFDQGIVQATAEEFADSGVPRVEEVGDDCRSDGGGTCVYEVTW